MHVDRVDSWESAAVCVYQQNKSSCCGRSSCPLFSLDTSSVCSANTPHFTFSDSRFQELFIPNINQRRSGECKLRNFKFRQSATDEKPYDQRRQPNRWMHNALSVSKVSTDSLSAEDLSHSEPYDVLRLSTYHTRGSTTCFIENLVRDCVSMHDEHQFLRTWNLEDARTLQDHNGIPPSTRVIHGGMLDA